MISYTNQCCTKMQAEEFKKLGILPPTTFYWFKNSDPADKDFVTIFSLTSDVPAFDSKVYGNRLPAPNVAELCAMLCKEVKHCSYHNPSGCWSHENVNWNKGHPEELFITQAECLADRLLYLMHHFPYRYTAALMNNRLRKLHEIQTE